MRIPNDLGTTMSEIIKSEGACPAPEKPASSDENVQFPPLPEPTDEDFQDDLNEEEKEYIKTKFADLNTITSQRLHCTACDRHLGSSSRNLSRVKIHPLLRTLVCQTCHIFYNSGEFEKGDDGSELYCRWCGQGGQVFCCSDCPHVFCAKCIKRNFGQSKILEIKCVDDWKCFKCNPECLKHLRAVCWALFQYCKARIEIATYTVDTQIRELLTKQCASDESLCCKNKSKRSEKLDPVKKKEENGPKKQTPVPIISKIPPTIQVKKFASINLDETPKQEKKPIKRPISPKNKPVIVKNPIPIATSVTRLLHPLNIGPPMKKLRIASPMMGTIRYVNDTRMQSYQRLRPKAPININNFNGFKNTNPIFNPISTNSFHNSMENMVANDNINLSLDNLTQGLDMSAAAAVLSANNSQNDDVVCTPDLPMESLNEVNEDNDDDVECITPGPSDAPNTYKFQHPPPLVPCGNNSAVSLSSDNIIQMTENDVTVNALTGGLKFRVDPQTLSSNKMYRLPDGRVFAININPKMPGGYSATIVAVTDNTNKATQSKGTTFAAKLSSVSTPQCSSPVTPKARRSQRRSSSSKRSSTKSKTTRQSTRKSSRMCDLNVPVEWYRYNLIDAVDALEYSLNRLQKLKKEATTMYLRTRTISEMKNLHKTLDRLLTTSSKRFGEIKDNLSNELKQFILRKTDNQPANSEDDDVEILSNAENDDPIFIDENSVESNTNYNENQEVDLTGPGSSEHNETGEKEDDYSRMNDETLIIPDQENESITSINENGQNIENNSSVIGEGETSLKCVEALIETNTTNSENNSVDDFNLENKCMENEKPLKTLESITENNATTGNDNRNESNESNTDLTEGSEDNIASKNLNSEATVETSLSNDTLNLESDKVQDSEISEELIESLLKDDSSTNCKD